MTRRAYNKKMPMAPMLRDMARCGQITFDRIFRLRFTAMRVALYTAVCTVVRILSTIVT